MALPTVADLEEYLGADAVEVLPEGETTRVHAAELAAQQSACRPRFFEDAGALYPADLLAAFLRRCDRHIAIRKLPLATIVSDGESGTTVIRLTGRDPEVRRLEGPYRKTPVG